MQFDWRRGYVTALAVAAAIMTAGSSAQAQVVPGSGHQITTVGDTFENEEWEYIPNWPKASQNLDSQQRHPTGESNNGRWYESGYRGQPDIVRRVKTPRGGLSGSKGALLLQTKFSGIPEMITRKQQQDDDDSSGDTGSVAIKANPKVYPHLDDVLMIEDREAFDMAEALAREEALLVGISSGANVLAARRVAERLSPDDVVVTVLCDTGTRYFSIEEYFKQDEGQSQSSLL